MTKKEFVQIYNKAIRIAIIAHYGQRDISGEPYILHPLIVSEKCISDEGKIVALLHDVVEDSLITIEDIRKKIPREDILTAIFLLTKVEGDKKGEGYKKYLERIKANELAREVKIADLKHNMDLSRINRPLTEWDKKRQTKYIKSFDYLTGKTKEYIL